VARVFVKNLRKEYGKVIAVKGVTLEIEDGEFMVLLGPSGCGKTTTLNCIAGLEFPTSGRVYFNGQDVTDLPPHRRNIAMVFQSALLYPHLSARDNIKMSLRASKLSKEEVGKRIMEAASLLGITHLLDKKPFEMSGGERQRVATAKAIVRNPSVFLMDEPLANLDAALREALRVEIVAIQKKLGATMVFVTHDQTEAMTMGDRIAVMNQGVIQQVGVPLEVYNNPVNLFVASFVGSPPMNFFEGFLETSDGGLEFVASEFRVKLPSEVVQGLETYPKGRQVILGVRPQDMRISHDSLPGCLKAGEIYGLERLGKETIVVIRYGERRIKVVASAAFSGMVGDSVYVLPGRTGLHFFDPESGRALR